MQKYFAWTNMAANGVDLDVCVINRFSNDTSCARIKDKCRKFKLKFRAGKRYQRA